jgi:small subunit ribosomal protein S14
MPPRPNARVLRDIKARKGVADNEISRRAYLYVARNQSLPAQVRYQAQLQLNTFGRYTRPTTVKNRCTETGRGRGVMGEFGLCRVSERIFSFFLSLKLFWFIALTDLPDGGVGSTVPVSNEGSCGRIAGCSKSLLVESIVWISSLLGNVSISHRPRPDTHRQKQLPAYFHQ